MATKRRLVLNERIFEKTIVVLLNKRFSNTVFKNNRFFTKLTIFSEKTIIFFSRPEPPFPWMKNMSVPPRQVPVYAHFIDHFIVEPCGSIESLQLHRRESKTCSVAYTLSPEENQSHKELVNIKSNFFVEQPYKELVILNSRYMFLYICDICFFKRKICNFQKYRVFGECHPNN